MNSFATLIFLASTAVAYPQLYRSAYDNFESGNVYSSNPSYTGYNNNQYKRASAVPPSTNFNSAPAEPTFTSALIYNPSTGLFETVLVENSMGKNTETMKDA